MAEKYVVAYAEWRPGQAVFNAAYALFPNEANALRGSDVDPFYLDDRIDAFLNSFEEDILYEDFQVKKSYL